MEVLISNETFHPVSSSTVPYGTRVFGSRLVDELKRVDAGVLIKSRLVVQNYADEGSAQIATKPPTVQRFTQRSVLSLAACLPDSSAFIRDITKAYVQSEENMEREVFIKPPEELDLASDIVLKVEKALYGIPASDLH